MTPTAKDVKPFEYVDVGEDSRSTPKGSSGASRLSRSGKMQLPLPAEESMKHIVMPVGFEVKLFVRSQPEASKRQADLP